MKATKLLCLVLTIAMMIPMAALMSSAITVGDIEAIDAVETYGQGKIIFDEDDFKDDVATNFTTSASNGSSLAWNAETGRLDITSGSASMITTLNSAKVPSNLVNYTVQADLYMGENGKKFGLGMNSTAEWAKGTYLQMQTTHDWQGYMNNTIGGPNASSAKVAEKIPGMSGQFQVNTKITMKLVVSQTHVTPSVVYNGVEYTFGACDLSKLYAPFGTGSIFFNQHNGSHLSVDNLTIWAGTGEPATSSATFLGAALATNDTIDLRFLVQYTESPAFLTKSVTVAGEAVEVTETAIVGEYSGKTFTADDKVYAYSVKLSAKQMTDDVVLTVKNGEETMLSKTYTVDDYCNYWVTEAKKAEATAAVKNVGNVCASMQLYGYMAQVRFGYNTDKLPNVDKSYLADLVK